MKRYLSAFITFAFLFLSLQVTQAQTTPAPELLNFQGKLAKPDGTPVTDGTYIIRFSLWSAVSGGTEKWFQVMNPVLVRNGTFGVLLGNGNPITANVLNSDTYLEIKVGNNAPLSPRQRLASVAYALKANTVPDSAITPAKINTVGASNGQSLMFNGSIIQWRNPLDFLLPYSGSMTSSSALFKVVNTGTGVGIEGQGNNGGAGVVGAYNTNETVGYLGTSNAGVHGNSTYAIGVYGTSLNGVAGRFDGAVQMFSNSNATALQSETTGLGNGGSFRIFNPDNIEDALIANTNGKGRAGIFQSENETNNQPALFIRHRGSGPALKSTASGGGLAALFEGTIYTTGLWLNTATQPGYVLTSDNQGKAQ